ncbi:hypothetical protein DMC63_16445 [Streptomyces sp. WAC 05977]|nr:hypothetical protein DMC63_16445 [Streptomyces sp. WAC 05977]
MVRKAQLRSSGHTRSDVRAKVDGGRWQIVLPGVVATFTGVLSRQAKLRAALLYGGRAAVLSHRTAAEEWHLVPIADGPVETTVPCTNSAISRPPLVVVHRSRTLAYTAIKTSPPRSPAPVRHRAGIRRGLELVRGGLVSALEVAYQEDVTDDAQGAAVTVRLDGRSTHPTPGVAFRDRRRDNAAELAGRARLVYGWRDVRDAPCAVAAEVRTILLREGWNPRGPTENVCPRCR